MHEDQNKQAGQPLRLQQQQQQPRKARLLPADLRWNAQNGSSWATAEETRKFQLHLAELIITVIITTSRGHEGEIPTNQNLDSRLPHTPGPGCSPPSPSRPGGGRVAAGGERLGDPRGEWVGDISSRPEPASPEELEEQERKARSPGWRRGASERGCHSLPGDLFQGLGLAERRRRISAAEAWLGALGRRRPLRGGRCVRDRRRHLHFPRSPGRRWGP